MTSDDSPTCCSSESYAGVSDGTTVSTCSVETTCHPSTCATSRCQTPSFLPRSRLPAGCLAPCYLAGSCNTPCSVGNSAWCEDGMFNSNEKETMQFLNDRLANYLEKVRGLEEMNQNEHWLYLSCYERYESELSLRQLVETDIGGLRRILDELTLCKADLEAHVESLKEDLLCLKKNHEEEVNLLRGQLGDRLSVELNSDPTIDLNRVLDEMRCQYETVLANNRRDAEEWFTIQTEELNQQQLSSAEQLQGCQTEIWELKRTANALDIELQAQQSLTESLECTVAETEAQYSTQLAQMQCLIDNVENQLAEIRCDLERQNQEYEVLLDTKARLEGEINTYRGLLESEDSRLPCNPCSTTSTSSNTCEPCSAYVLCTVENCCV
ncbi:keratin, type I cytoskeletal 40 [Pteropus vampyrus]|uniref:Keratin, type I cytoskeletal 40 n=1 Tax=Pteropus vampyrus TaxID=132908 RepID=A0A6P3RJN6_PTEVA|nr:keratin, type I cytoskeletal 40 [Pteropus vampyrus]